MVHAQQVKIPDKLWITCPECGSDEPLNRGTVHRNPTSIDYNCPDCENGSVTIEMGHIDD